MAFRAAPFRGQPAAGGGGFIKPRKKADAPGGEKASARVHTPVSA
jgi:hypothetical protein